MYYDRMSSQITKLVLVPLEEWSKQINKNGGDTYTIIEIPSSKPCNQERRGKEEEEEEAIPPPPPSPPHISHCPTSQDDEELGGAASSSSPSSFPSPPRKEGREGIGKGEGEGEGEGRGKGVLKLLEMLVIYLQELE